MSALALALPFLMFTRCVAQAVEATCPDGAADDDQSSLLALHASAQKLAEARHRRPNLWWSYQCDGEPPSPGPSASAEVDCPYYRARGDPYGGVFSANGPAVENTVVFRPHPSLSPDACMKKFGFTIQDVGHCRHSSKTQNDWKDITAEWNGRDMPDASKITVGAFSPRKSTSVARDFFMKGIEPANVLAAHSKSPETSHPSFLDFAFSGDLLLKFPKFHAEWGKWPGARPGIGDFEVTCLDIRIGQGYQRRDYYGPNPRTWWLGGPSCGQYARDKYEESCLPDGRETFHCMCESGNTEIGNRDGQVHVIFTPGGDSNTFFVKALFTKFPNDCLRGYRPPPEE